MTGVAALGKCAVVTGGTRGIGKAIVELIQKQHPDLHVAVLSRTATATTTATRGRVSYHACDVSQGEQVSAVAKSIASGGHEVSMLFNCAGVSVDGLLLKMDPLEIHSLLNTNLYGTIIATKYFSRPMIRHKRGAIVNVGSIVGQTGGVGQSVYSASKSGLHGFTRSLALELAQFNVTTNLLSPGFIDTDMTLGSCFLFPFPFASSVQFIIIIIIPLVFIEPRHLCRA